MRAGIERGVANPFRSKIDESPRRRSRLVAVVEQNGDKKKRGSCRVSVKRSHKRPRILVIVETSATPSDVALSLSDGSLKDVTRF